MERERREKLIACVKADNVKGFGEMLVPEVLSARFGRFSILSLLYLFGAKKIVRKYFVELIKERPRNAEEPFREADARFASVAGKALRHFVDRDVSPLEMLALLKRGKELRSLYAIYPNAERYLSSIQKIYYTRTGEGVIVTGRVLTLPRERISYEEKKSKSVFAAIFFGIGAALAAVTIFLSVWFGLGNNTVFYKARTGGEVLSALAHNQTLHLKNDVSLVSGEEESSSLIEGNEHVIKLSEPFLKSFSGEMRNVTFVLEPDFQGDAVILENTGKLVNVLVIAESLSLAKSEANKGLLTAVNKGTIDGCSAVLSVTIEGDSENDCYFAPFAGTNEGEIARCRAEGSITARNVDIAGVAGENETEGKVVDCSVNLRLSERTDLRKWTPNVAGVVASNRGEISGCVVEGRVESIYSFAEADGEGVAESAYAAGVVCVNGGVISNCVNKSVVVATAAQGAALAGGIVTLNGYETKTTRYAGSVTHCLGKSEVRATSSTHNAYVGGIATQNGQGSAIASCGQSAYLFAQSPETIYDIVGGVAGSSQGVVENCFFTGALENYDSDSLIGGICGIVSIYSDFFGRSYIDMQNNAFSAENVHASGAMISDWGYGYLSANVTYGAGFFESEESVSAYVESYAEAYKKQYPRAPELNKDEIKADIAGTVQVLDFGAEKLTASELKEREIYYE